MESMNRRNFLSIALAAPFAKRFISKLVPKPKYTDDLGITLKMIVPSDVKINRLDILYGFAVLKPDMVCRIES